MDNELNCKWLGLPSGVWPPDHYTLLGLQPGEADLMRIEQAVHARMARVRCYQIANPNQATEVMNRLAQAFACLTDPVARQAYNASAFPHLSTAPLASPSPTPAQAPVETITAVAVDPVPLPVLGSTDSGIKSPQRLLDWEKSSPPPVRLSSALEETPLEEPASQPTGMIPIQPMNVPLTLSSSGVVKLARPADPVFEAARSSPEARRGLGTRRALFERVRVTRRLLRLWDRAGKYLGKPTRQLTRSAEENELSRLLNAIDDALHDFPPLLAEPGKPGYRVLSLVTAEHVATAFKAMGPEERDALTRDWLAGQTLLQSHLQFLRNEVNAIRSCSWLGLGSRVLCAAVHDHPGWVYAGVLLVLGLVATVFLLA